MALNVATVRNQIAEAARSAGRSPDDVTLIGVSKGQSASSVAEARLAGVTHFGENYVQEGVAKIAALPRTGLTWHFIGQLQSNKTRAVAEKFDWVHTVDRIAIAERLSAQRAFHGPPLNVCLQVRLADEPTKGGIVPAELGHVASVVGKLPRLALRGLMCIPPATREIATQRGFFSRLRQLGDTLREQGIAIDTLSMGMSADFEAAIIEGATHIRVGTAIFGPRNKP